jgi:DtxR family Mn-dependent transcriptional regulator
VGDVCVLSSVTISTDDFLNYLNLRSLSLSTTIEILKIEKFDASMTILYNEKREILSKMVSEKLLVVKK